MNENSCFNCKCMYVCIYYVLLSINFYEWESVLKINLLLFSLFSLFVERCFLDENQLSTDKMRRYAFKFKFKWCSFVKVIGSESTTYPSCFCILDLLYVKRCSIFELQNVHHIVWVYSWLKTNFLGYLHFIQLKYATKLQ